MKKTATLLLFITFSAIVIAQTTGRIDNIKDAWGTTVSYIGDIKNKKPNGLGVAIYTNDFALRYAGYFVDGMYSGKGVLLFKDGTFLSGEWKNGKLHGNGAFLNKDGDLYSGGFKEGKKDGKGIFIYADNGFLTGTMKNDTYEGRCIYIGKEAVNVTDNIYVDGKKNGTGYQYDLSTKKLYEGIWENGAWKNSGTASYTSFLKDKNFYGEKTDNQYLVGSIDKTNNNLQDTAFFYDIKKHVRYFGYYNKGLLMNGIIVKDSSRFIGSLNDKGAAGMGSFYKINHFYDEGNYQNDYLDGSNSLSIDLAKKTIYYGTTSDGGKFSGKAWFSTGRNALYNGVYVNGAFTGPGYIVFSNGKTVRGTFQDGKTVKITSLTDENGISINLKPKTFAEALNTVLKDYDGNFNAYQGEDLADLDEDYYSAGKSFLTIPGSIGSNIVYEDFDFSLAYRADFYKGKNFTAALAAYKKLCKDISAASIRSKGSVSVPSGIVEEAKESETTRTQYSLSNSEYSLVNIYAVLEYKDGEYNVNILVGDLEFDE